MPKSSQTHQTRKHTRHRKAPLLGALSTALWMGKRLYQKQLYAQNYAALKGQVVVITGASSGIGAAYARVFAQAGCRLVLAARRVERLESLAEELQQRYSVEVLTCPTDVCAPEAVAQLVQQSLLHFGQIDIFINNAGIANYCFFYQDSLEDMRRVMEVNYWGVVHCTQAVLPHMMERRRGRIVNVASTAAKIATPGIAHYSATKHAVKGLSDGLRVEMARYGIRIHTICPTSTQTEIVQQSANHSGVNFNPQKYPGMRPERVATETLQALCTNTPELIIGRGEKVAVQLKHFTPGLLELGLKGVARWVFKEKQAR